MRSMVTEETAQWEINLYVKTYTIASTCSEKRLEDIEEPTGQEKSIHQEANILPISEVPWIVSKNLRA